MIEPDRLPQLYRPSPKWTGGWRLPAKRPLRNYGPGITFMRVPKPPPQGVQLLLPMEAMP